MNSSDMKIRLADLNDLEILIEFRIALFKEMGVIKGQSDDVSFYNAVKEYLMISIPNKKFFSWVAENNGMIIASSGLVFFQKPPSPNNPSGKEAYIMNMYTVPEWRGKGVATEIMREIFKFIKEKKVIKISLHATEIGKGVYAKLGFKDKHSESEMILQEEYKKI